MVTKLDRNRETSYRSAGVWCTPDARDANIDMLHGKCQSTTVRCTRLISALQLVTRVTPQVGIFWSLKMFRPCLRGPGVCSLQRPDAHSVPPLVCPHPSMTKAVPFRASREANWACHQAFDPPLLWLRMAPSPRFAIVT